MMSTSFAMIRARRIHQSTQDQYIATTRSYSNVCVWMKASTKTSLQRMRQTTCSSVSSQLALRNRLLRSQALRVEPVRINTHNRLVGFGRGNVPSSERCVLPDFKRLHVFNFAQKGKEFGQEFDIPRILFHGFSLYSLPAVFLQFCFLIPRK